MISSGKFLRSVSFLVRFLFEFSDLIVCALCLRCFVFERGSQVHFARVWLIQMDALIGLLFYVDCFSILYVVVLSVSV